MPEYYPAFASFVSTSRLDEDHGWKDVVRRISGRHRENPWFRLRPPFLRGRESGSSYCGMYSSAIWNGLSNFGPIGPYSPSLATVVTCTVLPAGTSIGVVSQ